MAAHGSADGLTGAQLETLLKETANPGSRCAEGCGAGLLNALGAVARASGSLPSGPAALSLTSTDLAFVQGGRAVQAIHLANTGGGSLTATVSASGAEAARLSFPDGNRVTLGPAEAGTLRVAANLNGLPVGSSQATLTVDAGGAGSSTVAVQMRAGALEDQDATVVFIFRDANDQLAATPRTTTVARAADDYSYRISLDENTYFAVAGIDDNRNGEPFDDGERTGFWRNVDNPEEIVVAAGQEVTGIDFDLVPFTTLSSTPPVSNAAPIPLR